MIKFYLVTFIFLLSSSSAYAEEVPVPSVLGLSKQIAVETLKASGFNVFFSPQKKTHTGYKVDTVGMQYPTGFMSKSASMNVFLALTAPIKLPSIAGKNIHGAKTVLNSNGIKHSLKKLPPSKPKPHLSNNHAICLSAEYRVLYDAAAANIKIIGSDLKIVPGTYIDPLTKVIVIPYRGRWDYHRSSHERRCNESGIAD